MLSVGRFLTGSAACAAAIAALACGSVALRRSRLPAWRGPRARLAETVIGLATFFAVAQALGAVHLFSSIALLVGELLAGATLCALGRLLPAADVHPHDEDVAPVRSSRPRGDVLAAIVGVGLVVVQWSTHVAYALGRGMTHSDTLWYHQPFAATFVQQHAFTGIDSVGYDAARFFPFNSQVVHAAGMLAFGRDFLSPFLNLGWLVLVLLGAWCLGERCGLGHVSVLGVGAVLGLPIMAATQPGQASSDVACGALLLAAVVLLIESRFEPAPLTLAGLAAGMALSTKITIAAPIAFLAATVLVVALARRRALAGLGWTIAFAATGSFWFLRDWVVAGTPLPWFDIDAGPIHWPSQIPPQAVSLAHDVLQPDAWRDLYLDGIWQGLGRAWPVVVVVLAASAVAALVRGPATQRVVGALVIVGVVGWVFTPLTGGFGFVFNLRYLGPVLLVAFALLPVVLPSRVTIAVFAVIVVADVAMPHRERIPAWPSGRIVPTIAVLAVTAACVCAMTRWRRGAWVPVAAALLVGTWFAQRYELDHRYVAAGLDNDAVNAYFRDVHDARVVVFGTDESYPLFGLDLSNRVARGDVPPIDPGTDPCRTWRADLAGRADYVVFAEHHFGYFVMPPEKTLAGDPAASLVLRAGESRVYEITGTLNPSAC